MSSKIALRGRPGIIQKQHQYVAFSMKTQTTPSNLPKGLPTLRGETKYLILVTEKQWNKVEKQITEDKDDQLYLEGVCMVQTGFNGIVVMAQTMTTTGLQRSRKEQQKAQANNA